MRSRPHRRPSAIGRVLTVVVSVSAAAAVAVAGAPPAAAHVSGAGELPAPRWLLAYGGAAVMLIAGFGLRAGLGRTGVDRPPSHPQPGEPAAWPAGPSEVAPGPLATAGRVLGALAFLLVLLVAVVGEDSAAANVAPVAVLVVWWVGLPLLCLVVGDVHARINPFDAVLQGLRRPASPERRKRRDPGPPAPPTWTAAAFAAAFSWFLVAYHAPGSPRSLAVFLVLYAIAALAGGWRWGRRWLRGGEAFGAISAAAASYGLRRSTGARPPGLAALAVVLLGGTIFDALAARTWWLDVLGNRVGWERTIINTLGLAWVVLLVGAAYLAATRISGRVTRRTEADLPTRFGVALFPLALGWFVAHDLTLLLFEGQNFAILASDPLGRGWDLFGTVDWYAGTSIVDSRWVRVVQLLALLGGHLLALFAARAAAVAISSRQRAAAVTWIFTGLAAASAVAAPFLLFGATDTT